MIYIGSPYSDPSPLVRNDRAYRVGAFAASCAKKGLVVYCPIASWHHLAKEHGLPSDFQFWKRLNFGILRHCTEMYVLCLAGWNKSIGLTGEIELARNLYIPVRHFDGETFLEVL